MTPTNRLRAVLSLKGCQMFPTANPNQSAFDANGELKNDQGAYQVGDYVQLDSINWPTVPGYDAEHARKLMQLVGYMARDPATAITARDQRILGAVAILHDLGRERLGDDPTHAQRGADIASRVLRAPGNYGAWNDEDIDEVCRLVYRHGDRQAALVDVRLQIFQDAERLEGVRFDVNTQRGIERIRSSCLPSMFFTPWAKNAIGNGNLRRWMVYRGWAVNNT